MCDRNCIRHHRDVAKITKQNLIHKRVARCSCSDKDEDNSNDDDDVCNCTTCVCVYTRASDSRRRFKINLKHLTREFDGSPLSFTTDSTVYLLCSVYTCKVNEYQQCSFSLCAYFLCLHFSLSLSLSLSFHLHAI